MGGPGQGEGGKAPEKPEAKSDFKTERSRSAHTAGKILLQWKVKEMGETGNVKENYQAQIQALKQGVSEAILQEQIPPGLHETIKRYFDTMRETRDEPAPPKKP
jgi:hypothetical protein